MGVIMNVTRRSAEAICEMEQASDKLDELKDLVNFRTEEELKLWMEIHSHINSAEQKMCKMIMQDIKL